MPSTGLLRIGQTYEADDHHIPRLPLELWEHIIDFVGLDDDDHDKRATLYACALICRSWVQRSQKNLYRIVNISDEPTYHRLVTSLKLAPSNGYYIKSVVVEARGTEYGLMARFRDSKVLWPYLFPVELGPILRNLEAISLKGHTFHRGLRSPQGEMKLLIGPHNHDSFLRSFRQFRSLHTLELSLIKFGTFAHLVRCVLSIPHLTHLSLSGIIVVKNRYRTHLHLTNTPRARSLALHSLAIGASDKAYGTSLSFGPDFVEWMVDVGATRSLRTAVIRQVDFASGATFARAASRMLRKSIKLESLELMMKNVNESVDQAYITLENLSQLRQLRMVQSVLNPSEHQDSDDIRWLLGILSTLSSPFVEELHLHIALRTRPTSLLPESTLTKQWKSFDELLSGPSFRSLKEVSLTLGILEAPEDDDYSRQQALLPSLHQAGLLKLRIETSRYVHHWDWRQNAHE